jgi:hypothetical protein
MTNPRFDVFHERLLALRISLHPGSRVIPGEEGTVVEVPIWFARRGDATATAETPLEAVEKLVQLLGQGDTEARRSVRTTEPRASW